MKILIFLLLSALLLVSCNSSEKLLSRNLPDKYTVDLPKGWRSKPKLLMAINDILTTAIDELKDREFCLDCETDYKVKIDVSEPITDQALLRDNPLYSNVPGDVRMFSFRAAFVVYKREKPIVLMKIVKEWEDAFFVRPEPPVQRASSGNSDYRSMSGSSRSLTIDPRNYVQKIYTYQPERRGSTLDQKELLILTEQKILEMQKVLLGHEIENQN